MNVEEYTQIVSDQIRSKKARPFVVKELQDHIRDQTAAYEAEGESKEEALDRAVMEMGDPAEVGIELDRIHRPQMSWETIAIVGLISVLSLLVQFLLQGADTEGNIGMMHLGHVVIGFILMIAIYRMDYSVLGKYSRVVAIFFLIVMTINISHWNLDFQIPQFFRVLLRIIMGSVRENIDRSIVRIAI